MNKKLNVKSIFLEKPTQLSERIILFILLTLTFMIFFNPLRFSPIDPIEAIFLSMLPALSISWGVIVFLRLFFKKANYIESQPPEA